MKFQNLAKINNLKDKVVLCRVDLNVSLVKRKPDRYSEFKIKKALPTVNWLLKRGARVILMSHFGRPQEQSSKFSLRPFSKYLEKKLNKKIEFLANPREAREKIKKSKNTLFLLENLRFFKGEEENSKEFAQVLARLGDLYVNEAFAVSHRAHASISAITSFLPSYAGLLFEKEVSNLSRLLKNPTSPLVLVLGGAKISTKIDLLKNLGKKAYKIILGGALAHPFLFARGYNIGESFIEESSRQRAKKLLNKKFILPKDVIVALKNGKKTRTCKVGKIGQHDIIVDIGPKTTREFAKILRRAKTIIWNGPMGMFEKEKFARGSMEIARAIGKSKAFSVAGGGETLAVIARARVAEKIDWVSTGGGAMLEFLSGKKLPGIEVLKKK